METSVNLQSNDADAANLFQMHHVLHLSAARDKLFISRDRTCTSFVYDVWTQTRDTIKCHHVEHINLACDASEIDSRYQDGYFEDSQNSLIVMQLQTFKNHARFWRKLY